MTAEQALIYTGLVIAVVMLLREIYDRGRA